MIMKLVRNASPLLLLALLITSCACSSVYADDAVAESTVHSSLLAPERDVLTPCTSAPELDGDATIGYGYVAYDYTSTIAVGTCTVGLTSPVAVTNLGPATSNFLSTADYASGTWYGIIYNGIPGSNGTLVSINPTTGVATVIGPTLDATGMAYDVTTSTMYAVDAYGSLCTIDLTSGISTPVATTIDYLITIACSSDGTLYGFKIDNDTMGTIDKTTGTWTQIGGVLSVDLNYAQDAAFDHDTGTLYLAAYEYGTGGQLMTADTTTGALTLIGAFPNGLEVSAFAIGGSGNAPPQAEFTYGPSAPRTGQQVSFDGSPSSDADGTIVSYEWDWDSDGSYDATGVTPNNTFVAAGEYQVTLRVTDNLGATDTYDEVISVLPSVSPMAVFSPLKTYNLSKANALYAEIAAQLPESVPVDIDELLSTVAEYIGNVSTMTNPIYANGQLVKALALLEEIGNLL